MYKLVGPVLVPQDQAEAKANVEKRLDFIRGDMCVHLHLILIITCYGMWHYSTRVEAQLKELGEKSEKKKLEASTTGVHALFNPH